MEYSSLHWLVVTALLGYVWVLVKVAKPTITKPIAISKASLWIQTIFAWLFTVLFGLLTLGVLLGNATRQGQRSFTSGNEFLGWLISVLGIPLLFALALRWSRSLMRNRIFVRKVNG